MCAINISSAHTEMHEYMLIHTCLCLRTFTFETILYENFVTHRSVSLSPRIKSLLKMCKLKTISLFCLKIHKERNPECTFQMSHENLVSICIYSQKMNTGETGENTRKCAQTSSNTAKKTS